VRTSSNINADFMPNPGSISQSREVLRFRCVSVHGSEIVIKNKILQIYVEKIE
jgi:hypothetical protein